MRHHIVEAMCTVLGYDVKSVHVVSLKPNISTAVVKYEDKLVTLNMLSPTHGTQHFTIYSDGETETISYNIGIIYKLGFAKFVEMLRTKEMPLSFDNLVKPVYIMEAMRKSYEENREIKLSELE